MNKRSETRQAIQKSGMKADRREFLRREQPLKPVNKLAVSLVVLGMVLLSSVTLAVKNGAQIKSYFSRPISRVRLDTQWQHLEEGRVREVLSGFMGAGYFDFDVLGVKSGLEQLAWVDFVQVKKQWPDTVSLAIREKTPIAKWGDQALLDQKGELFNPGGQQGLESLPLLVGPEHSEAMLMREYQQMNQLLFSAGFKIARLELTSRGSWIIELDSGLQVMAGSEDVMPRLERFRDFLTMLPAEELAGAVRADLRYANGVAISSDSSMEESRLASL